MITKWATAFGTSYIVRCDHRAFGVFTDPAQAVKQERKVYEQEGAGDAPGTISEEVEE